MRIHIAKLLGHRNGRTLGFQVQCASNVVESFNGVVLITDLPRYEALELNHDAIDFTVKGTHERLGVGIGVRPKHSFRSEIAFVFDRFALVLFELPRSLS